MKSHDSRSTSNESRPSYAKASEGKRKMWGGRFKGSTHPLMEKFGASVHFDRRLALYDIQGSIAHARMLEHCKIISKKEAQKIIGGLKQILRRVQLNQFTWDEKLEDVHTNIESVLRKMIGETADCLHTARSRNDQVVLDLKMYLRDEIRLISEMIRGLQRSLLKLAKKYSKIIIPGYTHLQRAQPVLLAHHLSAYLEMLERDWERLQEAGIRMNALPLGSCALAGTSFEIDRTFVAKELEFDRVSENSMDAVSDRDFVIETASDLAILGVHLSRLSEDLILWSTFEFGFIELPDAFSTGSSAMPQKKNPDSLELTRGKSSRLIGNLTSLLTLVKGLPLTYNRDLQEDKERIFDSLDTVKSVLEVMIELLPEIKFFEEFLQGEEDFSSSLDLAEFLVKKGVPFRQAHQIVGQVVRYCIEKGKYFRDLSLEEVKSFSDRFDDDFRNILGWGASVQAKRSFGSTSPKEVRRSMNKWEKKLRVRVKG